MFILLTLPVVQCFPNFGNHFGNGTWARSKWSKKFFFDNQQLSDWIFPNELNIMLDLEHAMSFLVWPNCRTLHSGVGLWKRLGVTGLQHFIKSSEEKAAIIFPKKYFFVYGFSTIVTENANYSWICIANIWIANFYLFIVQRVCYLDTRYHNTRDLNSGLVFKWWSEYRSVN